MAVRKQRERERVRVEETSDEIHEAVLCDPVFLTRKYLPTVFTIPNDDIEFSDLINGLIHFFKTLKRKNNNEADF